MINPWKRQKNDDDYRLPYRFTVLPSSISSSIKDGNKQGKKPQLKQHHVHDDAQHVFLADGN